MPILGNLGYDRIGSSDNGERHHFTDFECSCSYYQDTGFPCVPLVIRLLSSNEKIENFVDPLWTVNKMKECFNSQDDNVTINEPIVQYNSSPSQTLCQRHIELSAISNYLYKTDKLYRNGLEKLIEERSRIQILPPMTHLIKDIQGRPKSLRYKRNKK